MADSTLSNRPLRILISRPDGVGDSIITSALLPILRADQRASHIVYFGPEKLRPLLEPMVECYISPDTINWREILATEEIEASIHLHPHPEIAQATAALGIAIRLGYDAESSWLTKSWPDTRKQGQSHEIEHAFRFFREFSLAHPEKFTPLIAIPPVPRDALGDTVNRRFLVLHPAARPGKARLPSRVFIAVARAVFRARLIDRVVIVGAPHEAAWGDEILDELKPQLAGINLARRLSIAEIAGVCSQAKAFFGRDSGPAHLAAAVGCPTYVLSPTSRPDQGPTRWHPLGPRVTAIPIPGRARWWESTESANTRLYAKIDGEATGAAMVAWLQS